MNKFITASALLISIASPFGYALPFGVPGIHGPLEIMRDINAGTLSVKNNLPLEVTANAACGKNGSEIIAFTVRPGGPFDYPFHAKSNACKLKDGMVGRLNANSVNVAYRLPWQEGKQFCVVEQRIQDAQQALFNLPEGEAVVAARDGLVGVVNTKSQPGKYIKVGLPNVIEIVHEDGTVGRYFPVRSASVKVGDKIEAGQKIAEMPEPSGPMGSFLLFHVVIPSENGGYKAIPYQFSIGKPVVKFTPGAGMKPFAQYSTPTAIPPLVCNPSDPSKPRFPPVGILDDGYRAHQKKH